MTLAILISGFVLMGAGLLLIFVVSFQKPPAVPDQKREGLGEIFDSVTKLINAYGDFLSKFNQRVRTGVLLVTLGAALVGLAAYLEAKDAHDKAAHTSLVVQQAGRPNVVSA